MIAAGFKDFTLVKPRKELHLQVEFKTPESVFNYKLRGVEEAYKASRGNRYYSDLDQDWDDEAEEFFGDDEERDL